MQRRTGGASMHAWHPSQPPRHTPPPSSKTKLAKSFEEFDREHLRIHLLERSIFAHEHRRQHHDSEQRKQHRIAAQAHRALQANTPMLRPPQKYQFKSPESKRKIRINDHLSSEETKDLKASMLKVAAMKKRAAEIEQAEKATRHLLAVNKRKKEVERLLDQLTSFADPTELLTNQKATKATRTTVGFDLDAMQHSREQSDLQLAAIVDGKDALKNFVLEAPPDVSGSSKRIQDPTKVWESVSAWQQKAMQTNRSLLLFAANTKEILDGQLLEVEHTLATSKQLNVALQQEKVALELSISTLKREINAYATRVLKLEERLESTMKRMKSMETEFKVRTEALREELMKVKGEIKNLSALLHVRTQERDQAVKEIDRLMVTIRQLEVDIATTKQQLNVVTRKCDVLEEKTIELEHEVEELKEISASQKEQIKDLTTQLEFVTKQMQTMEEKYIQEREELRVQHRKETAALEQKLKQQQEESENIIHGLKKEIQVGKDQMAADQEKIKQAKNKQKEQADAQAKAAQAAAEQAAALEEALYRRK